MNLNELGLNRNLSKSPSETIGDVNISDVNNKSNSVDDASQILTGTVITACLFKSTDLPNRVEISNNDMSLYDQSTGGGGTVTGDTSTISFLRSYDSTKGFILQQRAGKDNNEDNVLELYALAPTSTRFNSLFMGRKGDEDVGNLGSLTISVDTETSKTKDTSAGGALNGRFDVSLSRNGTKPYTPNIILQDARVAYNNDSRSGQVVTLVGGGTNGLAGLAYQIYSGGVWQQNAMIYCDGPSSLKLGASLIPDTNNAYDIGSNSLRVRNIYASGTLSVGSLTMSSLSVTGDLGVGGDLDVTGDIVGVPTKGVNGINESITLTDGISNYTLNFTEGLLTSIT